MLDGGGDDASRQVSALFGLCVAAGKDKAVHMHTTNQLPAAQ